MKFSLSDLTLYALSVFNPLILDIEESSLWKLRHAFVAEAFVLI